MFTTQASPINRRGPQFIGGRPVFICGTRVLNTGWPVFELDACLLTKHRSLFALECRLFSGDVCVSGMKH